MIQLSLQLVLMYSSWQGHIVLWRLSHTWEILDSTLCNYRFIQNLLLLCFSYITIYWYRITRSTNITALCSKSFSMRLIFISGRGNTFTSESISYCTQPVQIPKCSRFHKMYIDACNICAAAWQWSFQELVSNISTKPTILKHLAKIAVTQSTN